MAFIANTMFEVSVSNDRNDQTQNIAGKFGTGSGSLFAGADCSAGFLVVKNGLIPSEGYESVVDSSSNPKILNGNTWYFNAATNGNSGREYTKNTGIYAFNNYDVSKAVSTNGSGNIWNIGAETLGLGLPAGERGNFIELLVGEQYSFGLGNFATGYTPGTARTGYATIANGLWSYSANAPADGSGVYGIIRRVAPVNEGASYWGNKYVIEIARADIDVE